MLAIIATIFGIATSLGLGANQINAGLSYMGVIEGSFINTIGIIILITLMGLASVVLGLKVGIKILSQINIVLCIIFLSFIFISGSLTKDIHKLSQSYTTCPP